MATAIGAPAILNSLIARFRNSSLGGSTVYGTPLCRAVIAKRSGKLRRGSVEKMATRLVERVRVKRKTSFIPIRNLVIGVSSSILCAHSTETGGARDAIGFTRAIRGGGIFANATHTRPANVCIICLHYQQISESNVPISEEGPRTVCPLDKRVMHPIGHGDPGCSRRRG
eukprot:XP_001709423.1 Hypothetical protein GL50803_31515 [Giardia lamblia ATCC 50803]